MIGLCWIRRDLRAHDHAALRAAFLENDTVYVVFVFDSDVLDPLRQRSPGDPRVHFIAESLKEVYLSLKQAGNGLIILYGNPVIEIPKLMDKLGATRLYYNRDYTPYPIKRDTAVTDSLHKAGKQVKTYKDHVLFEPDEILKSDKRPYTIFTPYAKQWRAHLETSLSASVHHVPLSPCPSHPHLFTAQRDITAAILAIANYAPSPPYFPGGSQAGLARLKQFDTQIDHYDIERDYFDHEGTSMLSVYIRHGCISIRDMLTYARTHHTHGAEKWLSELIWREFYQMIFFHYPEINTAPFQKKYRDLPAHTNETHLACWKNGQTGFPLIDAAMRCLNQTGWMHNRLRMIVASFTRLLDIHWKRGERYFSWKLLDYELASNNGGWQWATGIGCDPVPYFRIFNPRLQSEKYDPEGIFIKKYCPELSDFSTKDIHAPYIAKSRPSGFIFGRDYPAPIIDYAAARKSVIYGK